MTFRAAVEEEAKGRIFPPHRSLGGKIKHEALQSSCTEIPSGLTFGEPEKDTAMPARLALIFHNSKKHHRVWIGIPITKPREVSL
jgi:NAD(P)H-hydrate repair Nnr-like enzyme with NAD(P)H-hydrate epimerase domain